MFKCLDTHYHVANPSLAGADLVLAKAVAVVCIGVVLTLAFTAQVAVWIRAATRTELADFHYHSAPIAFSVWHYGAWGKACGSAVPWRQAQIKLRKCPTLAGVAELG